MVFWVIALLIITLYIARLAIPLIVAIAAVLYIIHACTGG